MVETIIKKEFPECFVSISSQILPQKREYERTSTTVINSYVGPPVSRYLFALIQKLKLSNVTNRLTVMQSSGGVLDAESCLQNRLILLNAGPQQGSWALNISQKDPALTT